MTVLTNLEDPEIEALCDAIQDAWGSVPAPPPEDLKYMAWGWGEEAEKEFLGVAPMDVNRRSVGFHAADPLLDLPARAVAAYLGTFLLAILHGLAFQKKVGMYSDFRHRAHVITFLELSHCWEQVKPHLSPKCRKVLAEVALYIASEHELLALTPEQVEKMKTHAADYLKSV
jgi:hypothetical protein